MINFKQFFLKNFQLTLAFFCILLLGVLINASTIIGAEKDFPFSSGQKINLIVPYGAGGGYDVLARLTVPFLEEQLKKMGGVDLNILVQNIQGGGGSIATSRVYSAKPDGTTLLFLDLNASLSQQLFEGNKEFDITKFTFLAQQSTDPFSLLIRKNLPINNIDDLVKRTKEQKLLLGTSGALSSDHVPPVLLSQLLKDNGIIINFDFVHFSGTGGVLGSMRRNEAEGICSSVSSTLIAEKEGYGKYVFTLTESRTPMTPHVPAISEYVKLSPEELDTITLISQSKRIFVGPPNMNANTANILKLAFEKALKDERLTKKADEINRPVIYASPEELIKKVEKLWQVSEKYKNAFK